VTGRIMQSDYMHWAKFKRPVRFALTASEVPHFRMDRLPLSIAELDLDGASHPRYAPLREAIARRYAVATDQVVAADGTSMANFLAMAALLPLFVAWLVPGFIISVVAAEPKAFTWYFDLARLAGRLLGVGPKLAEQAVVDERRVAYSMTS
jgi:hypothetical protein